MGSAFPTDGKPVAAPRVNHPILLSNLASGASWLVLLAALGSWALALIGAAYVVLASISLAAVYGREFLSSRQEVSAWLATWLIAVVLWIWVGTGVDGDATWLLSAWFGLVFGTGCYLAWQLLALVVRRVIVSAQTPRPRKLR